MNDLTKAVAIDTTKWVTKYNPGQPGVFEVNSTPVDDCGNTLPAYSFFDGVRFGPVRLTSVEAFDGRFGPVGIMTVKQWRGLMEQPA